MCIYSLNCSPRARSLLGSHNKKLLYILLCHSSALLYLHVRACVLRPFCSLLFSFQSAAVRRRCGVYPMKNKFKLRSLPCHTGRMIGFEFILKIFSTNNKRGRRPGYMHTLLTHFIIKLVLHCTYLSMPEILCEVQFAIQMGTTAHTENIPANRGIEREKINST
jgi:hypothetical protein